MALSKELISEFVKVTNDSKPKNSEVTVYGTVVSDAKDSVVYVAIDGSDNQTTPALTTTNYKMGDRVTIVIKDHTATVTGNLTDPAARNEELVDVSGKVASVDTLMAYKVTTDNLFAVDAIFANMKATVGQFTEMEAVLAEIEALEAKYASLDRVSAGDVEALNADIQNLRASVGTFTDLSAEDLEAVNAEIDNLEAETANFTYVSADRLAAMNAELKNLDAKYVNIDFANIDQAAIAELYAKSGLIENVTVSDGYITGLLVGVTIKGEMIEAGTLVADKLVIKGSDGLYYKLNTDGVTTEAEQTDYNSLNGSVITAKSITATKISVDDLVAFGATIGGFHITDGAIFSGVKETIDNTTQGLHLGADGQISLGDETNYLRYYKDEDGNYKLEISAESVLFGASDKSSIGDLKALTDLVKLGSLTDPETGEIIPSIELSEADSDVKQIITNEYSNIIEGEEVKTKIDAEGIEAETVTGRSEIRQENWSWVIHANGNLGLMRTEVID